MVLNGLCFPPLRILPSESLALTDALPLETFVFCPKMAGSQCRLEKGGHTFF